MNFKSSSKAKIHYNHVGYLPDCSKQFLCSLSKTSCSVLNKEILLFGKPAFEIIEKSGSVVYTGILNAPLYNALTEEFLFLGDFSSLKKEGMYQIRIPTLGMETPFFQINKEWILKELKSNIKSFYYQRSGIELKEEQAGKWKRPLAHRDDSLKFHKMMNRQDSWNGAGGWYDAGDYGKYIVNGGVSLFTLLLACKLCESESFVGYNNFQSDFEQPFSLLEETKYELDFFLRMQDTDGGVFFKVSPVRWDGFISPTESDAMQKRLVLGKSTTSTLNFAATLAFAYDVFLKKDPEFAETCKVKALQAFKWAKENPSVPYPNNTEGSGPYADFRYEDEFFWARGVLSYLGLLEKDDQNLLNESMKKIPPKFGADWRDTENLGWIMLALSGNEEAKRALIETADKILSAEERNAYHVSLDEFRWGSNGDIANHSLTLALAYSWTHKEKYLAGAISGLDFIYGKNPVLTCFVTGSAESSPKTPHHRLSHSDNVEEPIPGLLVGGINSDRQDMHRLPKYPSILPGFSYTDERCSFASNETAINWNAPLLALQALLYSFVHNK